MTRLDVTLAAFLVASLLLNGTLALTVAWLAGRLHSLRKRERLLAWLERIQGGKLDEKGR